MLTTNEMERLQGLCGGLDKYLADPAGQYVAKEFTARAILGATGLSPLDRFLDIGCGIPYLSAAIERAGFPMVFACDSHPMAEQAAAVLGIPFQRHELTQPDQRIFAPRRFDLVTVFRVNMLTGSCLKNDPCAVNARRNILATLLPVHGRLVVSPNRGGDETLQMDPGFWAMDGWRVEETVPLGSLDGAAATLFVLSYQG